MCVLQVLIMELKDIQKKDYKTEIICVRVTLEDRKWMKKNKIIPSLLFDQALKEIKELKK